MANTKQTSGKKGGSDALTKSSKKGSIELKESELGKVSGGVAANKFK
jgi:hypothetical protein